MPHIARRPSLVATVADILRRDLQKGVWREYLPGEHRLCEQLQISRPTLRLALNRLQREGLIEVSQGQRRRITGRARTLKRRSKAPTTIGVLTGLPYHMLSSFSLFLLGKLERCIYEAGHRFEMCASTYPGSAQTNRQLDRLISESKADYWVFLGFLGSLRYWENRYRGRILVVDARRSDRSLACIGVDTRAMAYHSVGAFLRRGHTRIALVNPRVDPSRDKLIEDGFRAGFAASKLPHESAVLTGHTGTVESIHGALGKLIRSKMPPTALLVTRPQHAVTALTYLIRQGVRVPRDMSLISLGYDPVIDLVHPLLSYYGTDWELFGKRLCRMVLQMAERGAPSRRHIMIMGEFHPRDTLASPRSTSLSSRIGPGTEPVNPG